MNDYSLTGRYPVLATFVLFVHVLFILWVVFGALLARFHPSLRWLHIISVLWGIVTEVLPWSCPLTLLEDWLERSAGIRPAQGPFLLRYLDKLVYPNISATFLTVAAVIICVLNLAYHARQMWTDRRGYLCSKRLDAGRRGGVTAL